MTSVLAGADRGAIEMRKGPRKLLSRHRPRVCPSSTLARIDKHHALDALFIRSAQTPPLRASSMGRPAAIRVASWRVTSDNSCTPKDGPPPKQTESPNGHLLRLSVAAVDGHRASSLCRAAADAPVGRCRPRVRPYAACPFESRAWYSNAAIVTG